MSFNYKHTDFEAGPKTEPQRTKTCYFWNKTRFLILLIGLLCITCTNANMILMNFTVICMEDVILEQKTDNFSIHWLEKPSDISLTFSAAAVGAIFGTIPAVTLISKYGIRKTLFSYGLISAIGTLFTPLAVHYGLIPVLIARLFQGIGASVLYSSIGAISESWSPVKEMGSYVAFLSAAFQISNIATMPSAGLLCESTLGWRSIYYLFAAITVLLYSLFFWFYEDSPGSHRNVSSLELKKIRYGKEDVLNNKKATNVKFLHVFKNLEVLEITVAIIGASTAVICLNNYGPIYLNKVLGLNIRETGYSNAIPYFFAAIVKFAAGPATDKLANVSERNRLILFAFLPQVLMAVGFLIMSFTTSIPIAQLAYTISVTLAGLNVIGMVKCAQIVAKSQISLIMAVISMSSWISAFILPIVIGLVCPTNSHEEWSRFYLAVAVFVVLTNIPFPFLARVQKLERVGPTTKF